MRDRDQRQGNEVEHPQRYDEVTITSAGVSIVLSVWRGASKLNWGNSTRRREAGRHLRQTFTGCRPWPVLLPQRQERRLWGHPEQQPIVTFTARAKQAANCVDAVRAGCSASVTIDRCWDNAYLSEML